MGLGTHLKCVCTPKTGVGIETSAYRHFNARLAPAATAPPLHGVITRGSSPLSRTNLIIMSAPQWLIDRMEALKKLPPPTKEQVIAQWEASARQMEEMDRPEHFKVRRDRKIKFIK